MIQKFAERHRLKVRRNKGDDTEVIAGKFGHLYEYAKGLLGLCFMPGRNTAHLWESRKRACLVGGMTLLQNGDAEGCLSFDPTDAEQSKLAIKAVKARPKRQMTPEQLDRLATMRQKAFGPSENSLSVA